MPNATSGSYLVNKKKILTFIFFFSATVNKAEEGKQRSGIKAYL